MSHNIGETQVRQIARDARTVIARKSTDRAFTVRQVGAVVETTETKTIIGNNLHAGALFTYTTTAYIDGRDVFCITESGDAGDNANGARADAEITHAQLLQLFDAINGALETREPGG